MRGASERTSARENRAIFCPITKGGDALRHRDRQRLGELDFLNQAFGGQIFLVRERSVESRDDSLLDLGPTEAVSEVDQATDIEIDRISVSSLEVNVQDSFSGFGPGQVDGKKSRRTAPYASARVAASKCRSRWR